MSIATASLPDVTASPAPETTLAVTPAPAPAPVTTPATTVAAAPEPAPTPTPRPQAPATTTVAAAAPASDPGFLPVPELRTGDIDTPAPPPVVEEAAPDVETATLEERMLVESEPLDPSVASAYAAAESQEGGLSGLLLRLIQEQNGQ